MQKGYVSARNLQCTASESIADDYTRFRVSDGKNVFSPCLLKMDDKKKKKYRGGGEQKRSRIYFVW